MVTRIAPRIFTQSSQPLRSALHAHPKLDSHLQSRNFIDSLLSSALGPCPLRQLTHTKVLPYSSKAIFKAISDIGGYPDFVPFTISSTILSRDADGYPTRAKLKVGYDKLGLEEIWESQVTCQPENGLIEARSSDSASQGLFEVLSTKWKIDTTSPNHQTQSQVKLDVDVKFRNPVYDQLFAQVEQKVANSMISAFEKRVRELEAK